MGNMIGPLSLTVGQPYQLQLDQATKYIDVQNDSPYDVWVYFGNVKPTDLTNAEQTWHRTARRDHTSLLPVESYRGASPYEYSNNALGAFQGTVWLMQVNPGGLALTGTTSARNQVFVTPYLAGQPLPAHAARSSSVDLTSQARMINVPLAVQPSIGTWQTAGSSSTFIGGIPALTAANLASGIVNVYLYGGFITAQHVTGTAFLELEAVILNGSLVQLGPAYGLWQGDVWANAANNTHDIWPLIAGPAIAVVSIPLGGLVSPASVALQLFCNGVSGVAPQVAYDVLWAVDGANTGFPGPIGVAYSGLSGGPNGPY